MGTADSNGNTGINIHIGWQSLKQWTGHGWSGHACTEGGEWMMQCAVGEAHPLKDEPFARVASCDEGDDGALQRSPPRPLPFPRPARYLILHAIPNFRR